MDAPILKAAPILFAYSVTINTENDDDDERP